VRGRPGESARITRGGIEMVRGRPPRRMPQKLVLFSRPSLASSIIKARSFRRDHRASWGLQGDLVALRFLGGPNAFPGREALEPPGRPTRRQTSCRSFQGAQGDTGRTPGNPGGGIEMVRGCPPRRGAISHLPTSPANCSYAASRRLPHDLLFAGHPAFCPPLSWPELRPSTRLVGHIFCRHYCTSLLGLHAKKRLQGMRQEAEFYFLRFCVADGSFR
jgi:hypothetical protein